MWDDLEPVDRDGPYREATCETHGAYQSRPRWFGSRPTDQWTKCPECVRLAAEQRKREQDELRQQRMREAYLAGAGTQGRFETATFSTFEAKTAAQRRVLATCREFVDELRPDVWGGLWLIGPPGVGKTHLGCAMVRAYIEKFVRRAHIVAARELVREIRATWRKGAVESEEEAIDRYAGFSLLVLDEIGVGFGTEAELVQLYDVIDRRYRMRRPVVLLSNLNAEELRSALGDRLWDRLREDAQVLACSWPSHRATGRARTRDEQ